MTATKVMFIIAMVGHIICWQCDRLITYAPGGRFNSDALKDNSKMAALYTGMELRRPELSMGLGVLAMTLECFGYLAIADWMRQFSPAYGTVLGAAAVVAFVSGVVHHVLCGAVEWLYVRLGCTPQAREVIFDLFKKTSYTMIACFIGLMVFSIALFIALAIGATPLPRWACIFNLAVIFAAMAPFRIVGTMNLAGAAMFLGLLLVI